MKNKWENCENGGDDTRYQRIGMPASSFLKRANAGVSSRLVETSATQASRSAKIFW